MGEKQSAKVKGDKAGKLLSNRGIGQKKNKAQTKL